MLLGIKMLLALHVFSVAFLITAAQEPAPRAQMFGAVVSGLIIILISAYLKGID